MKTAFITTIVRDGDLTDLERLKKETSAVGFATSKWYVYDGRIKNLGYAYSVNDGIKKAMADGCELFVIFNLDISFGKLTKDIVLESSKNFDVWNYGLQQNGKTYYGGHLDRFRMSGGLLEEKPDMRFTSCDFISGSLMFIKKRVFEGAGFFDESYFLYYEDVDFCFRARRAGFSVGVDVSYTYKHFEKSDQTNQQKKFLLAKNRLKFLYHHGTIVQKLYELIRLPKTFYEEFFLIKDYILSKKFLINFSSLNASSLLNKLMHFVFFLLLIRIVTPADYGIYTLVWAHVALLSPLLDFGTTSYGLVYSPQRSEKDLHSLFTLRIILSVAVFVLTIILAFIFRYSWPVLVLVILNSFTIFSFMSSGSYLIATSLKEKLYLSSAASLVFNAVLIFAMILTLLFYRNLFSLFVVVFFFYNLYAFVCWLLLRREVVKFKFEIDFNKWYKILKKSSIFLLIGLFSGFYFKLDVFLLNFIKGASAVGIYSSGYKFLDSMMLLVSSYNVSSLPRFSVLGKGDRTVFVRRIKKDLIFVVLLGAAAVIGIYALIPTIFPLLLPKNYEASFAVIRIVILALPFILATSVFLNAIYVIDKPYFAIGLFAFQIVFNFSLNYFLIPIYSYTASAYITVVCESINTLVSFLYLNRYVKLI